MRDPLPRMNTRQTGHYDIEVSAARRDRPSRAAVIRAVRAALRRERAARAAVSVAIVNDAAIADLHRRHLRTAEPTDVMSFDLRDEPAPGAVDGQVVVSDETARREARRRRIPAEQELLRYVIHGTLHLLGYLDDTPQRANEMHRIEDELLSALRGGRAAPARRRSRGRRRTAPGKTVRP